MDILVKKLCVWMEGKITEAKAKGIVFGLSGGLDSAVVAALSIRIFPKNTLAILIPCHSLEADINDALSFIDKFNIPYKIIDVSKIYDSFIYLLNDKKKEGSFKLAEANKTELTIGYFTKFGDGGADILPLGNLLKNQVKELA